MSHGTIRVKFVPQEGKDYTGPQTIVDNDGFPRNLAPNETVVLPDNAHNLTRAANATVAWETATQQSSAPEVVADVKETVPGPDART